MAKQGYVGNLTPEQQDALDGFRFALNEHYFPESGLLNHELSVWGVSLVDLPSQLDNVRQSVVLLKFLRAREFDIHRAAEKLMRTLQWRKEFKVDNLVNETFPKEIETLAFNFGKDRMGRPVQYNFYGHIDPATLFADDKGIEQFVRWRVKFMEETIAGLDFENGLENMVHVHDYSGVKVWRMDRNQKAAMKRIIRLFGDYYPEMLAKKFFINVPRVAEVIFNVCGMFVHPRTRAKFRLCCQHTTRSALLGQIDPEELPAMYGGFISSVNGWQSTEPITIPARERVELEFELKRHAELRWEYVTESLDVSVYVADRRGESDGAQGRKEYGAGKYKAMQKGKVVLVVDNSYSYFTEKTVWIRSGVFGGL